MTTAYNPAIYTTPAVTDPKWGGVADGLLAPVIDVPGTYPTGFTGGEDFYATVDGVKYHFVFTANDQTLNQVVARINSIAGVSPPIASNDSGWLKIAARTMGSVIQIGYGTALATLGISLIPYYGLVNPNATDNCAAFQKAIDSAAGGTLAIPGGAYRVKLPPGQDCALYMSLGLKLTGAGGIVNNVPQILFDDPTHSGDLLCIESSGARGTVIEGITIRNYHNTGDGRYAIVIHTAQVVLERVTINGFGDANSYGVLVESGIVGAGIIGATRLPAGTYIDSNFLRIYKADFEFIGDQTTGTGGGIYGHGSDSQTIIYDWYSTYCGTSFTDSTLIGMTLIKCYSEANHTPIYSDAPGGTRLYDCYTEDAHPPNWAVLFQVSYSGSIKAPVFHFGEPSKLFYSYRDLGGPLWEAEMTVPSRDMALTWWRAGQQVGTGFGHKTDSQGNDIFAWMSEPLLAPVPALTWGLGVTDPYNPRGPALPIVGRAWLNGAREWTLRQVSITVAAGINVLQLFPDYASATALTAGDPYLSGVDTHVWCTVELHEPTPDVTQPFPGGAAAANAQAATRAAALGAAPVRVGGTVLLWQDSDKGNWAVQIFNDSGGDVVVDLVWNFKQWKLSGAASGP